jgi:hypothetical protein
MQGELQIELQRNLQEDLSLREELHREDIQREQTQKEIRIGVS